MARTVDYYFSLVSPWAYIGHAAFMDVARRRDVSVNYKPVALLSVFGETGGVPLAKRHPARQRYRIQELQRWREKRGLNFHLHPRHWPFDAGIADRFVIATAQAGIDPDAFMRRAFAAVWEDERDLADEAMVLAIGDEAGLPAPQLGANARSDVIATVYEQNVEDAIAADAFGSPCFVLDGEVFWGQDRLDLLDDALASGRRPFRSDA